MFCDSQGNHGKYSDKPFQIRCETKEECFHVARNKYHHLEYLGEGAFSTVCTAYMTNKDLKVVIKKQENIFQGEYARPERALREVYILAHVHHPKICKVFEQTFLPNVDELYVVMEFCDTDLHKVIYSETSIGINHIAWIIYQLCTGLQFLHSAGIIHRDIKPDNILLNGDCTVKLCDFGLSRSTDSNGFIPLETDCEEYIVTRWYRAPEILVSAEGYNCAIDMWSVGCLITEMLSRVAVFRGADCHHMLELQIVVVGSPTQNELNYLRRPYPQSNSNLEQKLFKLNDHMLNYVDSMNSAGVDFDALWKPEKSMQAENSMQTDEAVPYASFIQKLLTFDPRKRMTAAEACKHSYMNQFSYPLLEQPSNHRHDDVNFIGTKNDDHMKSLILKICSLELHDENAV